MMTHEFPPVAGGIATYTAQLATAASKLGHDITVVAPRSSRDHSVRPGEGYPFRVIPFRAGIYSIRKLPHLIWRTYRWAKPEQFDLIHAVDWPHIMASAYLNRFKDIPFAATIYGTEVLLAPDAKQIRYLVGDNIFTSPLRIFAISEFARSLLLDRCKNVKPENVVVTPPGVAFERFAKPQGDYDFRQRFSIPDGNHIILTVSRLDERKGHGTVLKALARLSSELKRKTTYVIAGAGKNRSYIAKLRWLAGKSGVYVIFMGEVDQEQLPSLYAGSTVFCMTGEPHPEKVEGFGLVYLEAAAAGLPAIASRIGGVPEVVIHDKTGLLIKPQDIDGLAAALTIILSDEGYRAALGNSARERARDFTWDRCARQTYGSAE